MIMPTATIRPPRNQSCSSNRCAVDGAVSNESKCARAAQVSVRFAVAVRTRLQRKRALAEVEEQETRDCQPQNPTTGPPTRSSGLNGFWQQIKERCSEQDPSSKPQQEMDVLASDKRKPTPEQMLKRLQVR